MLSSPTLELNHLNANLKYTFQYYNTFVSECLLPDIKLQDA